MLKLTIVFVLLFQDDCAPINIMPLQNAYKLKPAKRYPCGFCDQTYDSQNRLNEHLHEHTGKKHFECNICKERFRSRYLLGSHMLKEHVECKKK